MVIPVIISFIISSLFLNIPQLGDFFNNEAENVLASVENRNIVFETTEKIKNWPAIVSDFFYPQNNLPPSEDKKNIPQRINKTEDIYLYASSAIAIDAETENIIWGKEDNEIRSIASISKLMSALVFLDNNPGWEVIYKIKREDRREGGKIYLYFGDEVRVRDLFNASLIGSDNTATIALVSASGLEESVFVEKMNKKAVELNLLNTGFFDPSGLSEKNISTALEVAKLAKVSFSQKDIIEAVSAKEYKFSTLGGREIIIPSTDILLEKFPQNNINISGGKTGYIEAAGFCFVGEFVNENQNRVISVVLGAENIEERFNETKKLIHWIYSNFQWP